MTTISGETQVNSTATARTPSKPDDADRKDAGTTALPLVLDMDGTLIATDLLVEGIVNAFFRNPLGLLLALPLALISRAAFKRRIARLTDLDVDSLPVNDEVLAYARREHARGREIHLYTAADQALADRVAARFGLFSTVRGSTDDDNLKGARKRDALVADFADGFVYAGDHRADLPIWEAAEAMVLVGASPGLQRQAEATGSPLEAAFGSASGSLRDWRKSLRLHQWAKNMLVFVPLLLSHLYTEVPAILSVAAAFLIFSIAASATYILNDLSDLSADRRHAVKHNRPFAAGRLNLLAGLGVSLVIIAGALVCATLISTGFLFALMAYLVVTLSYSFGLKRVPVLDVVMLAGLFTLRLVMGTEAISVPYSEWLLTFSMFFFISLSLGKRYVEVSTMAPANGEQVAGRGYRADDTAFIGATGIGAGVASVLILVLFLRDDAFVVDIYQMKAMLWGIPVVMALFLSRIWLLAGRGELNDDPVAFAVKDKLSYLLGAVLVACFAAAVLIPAAG